jgi:hypothetical protein
MPEEMTGMSFMMGRGVWIKKKRYLEGAARAFTVGRRGNASSRRGENGVG